MAQLPFDDMLTRYRRELLLLLGGAFLVGFGLLLFSTGIFSQPQVEVVKADDDKQQSQQKMIVEIAGSVKNPGVYEMEAGARVADLLNIAGGTSDDANHDYISKAINQAAPLIDGQKLYIPSLDEQSGEPSANESVYTFDTDDVAGAYTEQKVNINQASESQLDELWGIGPATAQKVIAGRPYSSVEELLSKKVLKSNVYETNKDLLSVY